MTTAQFEAFVTELRELGVEEAIQIVHIDGLEDGSEEGGDMAGDGEGDDPYLTEEVADLDDIDAAR